MKNKMRILSVILAASILFIPGCSSTDSGTTSTTTAQATTTAASVVTTATTTKATTTATTKATTAATTAGKEKTVEITIAKDMLPDGIGIECLSEKENTDGSVTYTFTEKQYADYCEALSNLFDEGIKGLLDNEANKTLAGIERNADFSEFNVFLSSDTVGLTEQVNAMSLMMWGSLYNGATGGTAENIKVVFLDNETKEVIDTMNQAIGSK